MIDDINTYFKQSLTNAKSGKIKIPDSDWESEPPRFFEDYLESGDYVNPVEFSEKQEEATKLVLGTEPRKIFSPERKVSLVILVVGKGGGKDWWTSYNMDYVITVLLKHKNPNKFLDIEGNLDFLNVSIKGVHGERVFFDYFKQRVKENKFYRENYTIYEDNRIYSKPERIKSKGIIKIAASSVIFPKNIRCFSETNNNESWDGYNVIFFVLDEISGFITEKKAMNGRAIFETANSSCISRRTRNYKGLGVVVSYPRQEKNDIILELYEQSRKPGYEHWYGLRCFSWHFKHSKFYCGEKFTFANPRINRILNLPDDKKFGIKIPTEYEEDFLRKPEESLTKYCALPPRATGGWIEYQERIFASVDMFQQPIFLTEDFIREITNPETKVVERFLAKRIVSCTEKNIDIRKNYRYVGWVDLGETFCDAVIVLARKETIMIEDENQKQEPLEICRVVDVINWIPEPGISLDMDNIEDFILNEIPRYINLREVGKDRWQSASLNIKLKKKGINSFRYDLLGPQYDIGKYFFYLGAVRIYDEEKWVDRNKKELTSLEQILALDSGASGPVKKPDFKKDKSDGVIGCINICLGEEWNKKNRPIVQKMDKLGRPFLTHSNPYKAGEMSVPSKRVSRGIESENEEKKLGKPIKV